MRRLLLTITCCTLLLSASADHITGGEMFYAYLGQTGNQHRYSVTLKLFMRCNSGRQFPDPAIVSIFNKGTGNRVQDLSFPITRTETLQLVPNDPCITDPPTVCYEVAYYNFILTLPSSSDGYIIASEVNYRIRGINNINSSQVGATYTADIPGNLPVPDGPVNQSAVFTGNDLVVVCADNYFTYSFRANDLNGDRIRYSFCAGYNSSSGGGNSNPPGNPPYEPLFYNGPQFSASAPLGPRVTIDPNTGLISGIAPEAGIYVVTVCAEEIRNDQVIAVQRKDLQINITDCSIASARLEDDYMLCRDTRNLSVQNLSNSPLISSWNWTVFNAAGNAIFNSNNPVLNYTFATDGRYTVKLVVNRNQPCSDSTTAPVFVFPGMRTAFDYAGICYDKPTQFTDLSSTQTGNIQRWSWDFGEASLSADTSNLQNPQYTFPNLGNKQVVLTVYADNGCRDTARRTVGIITKPPIQLAFRDTLICRNDLVTLQASGMGQFSWSPSGNMQNPNSPNPTVRPLTTTKYFVQLDADGCVNTDSVQVRVVNFVTVIPMSDTTICRGDTIRLQLNSDGLSFHWSPLGQVLTPGLREPLVVTPFSTRYEVRAFIGGCSATAGINVRTEDYPTVDAGNDTTICYNTFASLAGSTNASSWSWSPAPTLTQSTLLQPMTFPPSSTTYTLSASNPGAGCPKPVFDTVLVTVLPKIIPLAGNDTAVLTGQPLQLFASGGLRYEWEPAFYLDDPLSASPVALFDEGIDAVRFSVRVYNEAGCSDTTTQWVKVFATPPTVFVPTAFTPNGDGLNDVLRPLAVGIQDIRRFEVFNRWGQRVFSTRINGAGWDGTVNGKPQPANTFVWYVEATDYLGKSYFLKGQVTLIR